jgi:DNA-binding MarR family transcriptional regulator
LETTWKLQTKNFASTLLENIENDPDVNQSTLATQLGVAVGTVNWHIKRLIAKGYVKVKRAERKKLRYIITPEGIALRARLAVDYVERSLTIYRRTRQKVRERLNEVQQAGHNSVTLWAKAMWRIFAASPVSNKISRSSPIKTSPSCKWMDSK